MRRRWRYFRLFGLMSIVFAVVAGAYLAGRRGPPRTSSLQPPLAAKARPRVVIAAEDLPPRTLLTPALLEEREVPVAPEGVFTVREAALYRLTTTFIRKGEPIFQQHVTPPLKDLSAAYLIPLGQVGMALTVANRETVPPLRPGDYISIHASFAGLKVRTIVPRALVLAVDNRVGEVLLATSGEPGEQSPAQQTQEQSTPQREKLTLFIALSPQEAKAVALALDNGATFFYALHPSPPPLLPPPELEHDLTLRELVRSPQVEAVLVRKQHGTAPPSEALTNSSPARSQPPPQPVVVKPMTAELQRLSRSVENLHQRVAQMEKRPLPPVAAQKPFQQPRQIVGVLGDQKVTFQLPAEHGGGGR